MGSKLKIDQNTLNQLDQTINSLYLFGNASQYADAQNELIINYLEIAVKDKHEPEQIKKVISMAIQQTQFVIAIQEIWREIES